MKYINLHIGGKNRGFKFGLGFFSEMLHELETTIEDIDNLLVKAPLKGVVTLMYYSAKYNLMTKGETPDFTLYDVYDWIEDQGGIVAPVVQDFNEAFKKSLNQDVPKDEEPQTGDKKKEDEPQPTGNGTL